MSTNPINTECCPKFNPTPWDNQVIEWNNKNFIKDKVCTFLYMPINFGKVMVRLNETVTKASANIPDWLCLSEHTSKWNMDVLLAVDKEIPDANNTTLSGKFYSRVDEGALNNTGKWTKEYEKEAKAKGYAIKKM